MARAWKVPAFGHVVVTDPEFAGIDLDHEGVSGTARRSLRHVEGWCPSLAFIGRQGEVQFGSSLVRPIPHEGDAAIGEACEVSGCGGGVDGGCLGSGPRFASVG